MRIVRCDLLPQDCVVDHLCPVLDARPQPAGGWRARCPAHDDEKASLTIALGTRGARIVWNCHGGCTMSAVQDAMVHRGISEGCIPMVRTTTAQRPSEEADRLARIEQIITSIPDGDRSKKLRVEIGAVLWGCDPHAAARKLGVGWRTAYRAGRGE